jgi:hypothetical protein
MLTSPQQARFTPEKKSLSFALAEARKIPPGAPDAASFFS